MEQSGDGVGSQKHSKIFLFFLWLSTSEFGLGKTTSYRENNPKVAMLGIDHGKIF